MARRGPVDREIESLARKIADEVVRLNEQSRWLVWFASGRVRVLTDKIVPQQGKRHGFKNKLRELLHPHGWTPVSNHSIYEKQAASRYSDTLKRNSVRWKQRKEGTSP